MGSTSLAIQHVTVSVSSFHFLELRVYFVARANVSDIVGLMTDVLVAFLFAGVFTSLHVPYSLTSKV